MGEVFTPNGEFLYQILRPLYPDRKKKEFFTFPESLLDRLRAFVVELDARMPMASFVLKLKTPGYKNVRENLFLVLESIKENVEDLEVQSEGFSERTRKRAMTEPIDSTILSVNKMKTQIKKLESYYLSISNFTS